MNISGSIDTFIGDQKLYWRFDRWLREIGRSQGFFFRNKRGLAPPGRTLIFCTSYINDVMRYKRWIDYFYPKLDAYGAENLFLINDGPDNIDFDSRLSCIQAAAMPCILPSSLNIIAFEERLGRPARFSYPGWWRSFTFSVRIARQYGFKKIIHIESDAYVLSQRLTNYIRCINCGWTVLWSPTYRFPETAVQIICEDAFPAIERIASMGSACFRELNRPAEYLLPFDKVESRFHGDRCGVIDRNTSLQGYDYLAQVPTSWSVVQQMTRLSKSIHV
ncbi:hypothetical protein [Thiocystis violascens]|uniref:Uncharacterized protein n=1 Tax=Thiocystis violascens (strain ATCC 17096 / DSM 198 / 6111) TaxID=765911 RepID=I3YFW5_THIV6|nr:hypothetical protein [Thiocystis violascens]AFL75883.1 hypothetical protein Thivi_4060 [Thiocystis violascens DSM 198]